MIWTHAVDENAWHQVAPYIFAGAFIDLVSNLKSPALALSDAQLENLVLRPIPPGKRPGLHPGLFTNIVWAIIFLGPALATLAVIFVQRWEAAHVMTIAFGGSKFIDVLLAYFRFAGNHAEQMRELGASERLALMYAVYITNLLSFAFTIILILKQWVSIPPQTIQKIYEYGKSVNTQRVTLSPLTSLLILMCFFLLIATVLNILDFAPSNLRDIHYAIHVSDLTFLWFSLFLTGLLGFIWFIRFGSIALRLGSLGLWGQDAVIDQTKVP